MSAKASPTRAGAGVREPLTQEQREEKLSALLLEFGVAQVLRHARLRQRRFSDGGDDVNYYERELDAVLRRVRAQLAELEGS